MMTNRTKNILLANIPFVLGITLLMVTILTDTRYIFPAFLAMAVLALLSSIIAIKMGLRLPNGTVKQKRGLFLFDCVLWLFAIGVMYYTLFR
ncbi:MAG: hypothetical protein Q4G13_05250 [Moraxella sp.]|nr:hypothetical protein [Moraxella sp.]